LLRSSRARYRKTETESEEPDMTTKTKPLAADMNGDEFALRVIARGSCADTGAGDGSDYLIAAAERVDFHAGTQ
jgi:hypothetical protein